MTIDTAEFAAISAHLDGLPARSPTSASASSRPPRRKPSCAGHRAGVPRTGRGASRPAAAPPVDPGRPAVNAAGDNLAAELAGFRRQAHAEALTADSLMDMIETPRRRS